MDEQPEETLDGVSSELEIELEFCVVKIRQNCEFMVW